MVASHRQRLACVLIHVGGQVRVGLGNFAFRRPAVHGRPFFQGQGVEGDVLRH